MQVGFPFREMRDFLPKQCGGKVREMIGSWGGGGGGDLMARERIQDEARHFNLGCSGDQMMILPLPRYIL